MSGADPSIADYPGEDEASALLDLALSRPVDGGRQAAALIKRLGAIAPSAAWQALALAERERGDISTALRHLRRAVDIADAREDAGRRADVRGSLATTLTIAGRTKDALVHLHDASELAVGLAAARVAMRRGIILWDLGRYQEALESLRACIPVLRRHNDTTWEARALLARAITYIELGAFKKADTDLGRAAALARVSGQEMDEARTLANRGWLRYRIGDLPGALEALTTASNLFRQAAANEPSVEIDRCIVLLAAGLPQDALKQASAALDLVGSRSIRGLYRADVEVIAAEAALAVGEGAPAYRHAKAAFRAYRAQDRHRSSREAELLVLRARWALGERSPQLAATTARLADDLAALGSPEAGRANLLAGRIGLTIGNMALAHERLSRAASQRRGGAALDRVAGWFAYALLMSAGDSRTAVASAARQGLRVLDEHRLVLGATELRAAATAHGIELASLVLRQAKVLEGARPLLVWSERSRATTLALPPVRPADDRELTADLGRLRDVTHKLSEARTAGTSTASLERERTRLEEAVRAQTLQTPGRKKTGEGRFEVSRLLDTLGERRLVSIVEVDGELTVLVAANGRVRKFSGGRLADTANEVDYARFALRSAAGTGVSRADVALRRLEAGGPRLQEMLFGDAVRALGDGPLVIVPPARLHATPWGVLPALQDRPFAVAPSAASWLRAATRRAPARRDVVLVAGPNLGSRGAEVTTLRRAYEDARVLANGSATCDDALKALNGAWLAHVAAHGVLRADNPLFSALTLDDGPLTVYDLERLRRAPYRLILSACESGIGAKAGVDEVLGLASAVISLGTAGLLGSTVIVDDEAAVRISLIVHEHLRAGTDLAHALYRARQKTAGDPVAHATSLGFLAFGAA